MDQLIAERPTERLTECLLNVLLNALLNTILGMRSCRRKDLEISRGSLAIYEKLKTRIARLPNVKLYHSNEHYSTNFSTVTASLRFPQIHCMNHIDRRISSSLRNSN